MIYFTYILMAFLIICAIAVSFSKNILNSVLIFMSYSLVMSIIWMLLESPDLAITEAAVGAGVTSILFFITLKKVHAIKGDEENECRVSQDYSLVFLPEIFYVFHMISPSLFFVYSGTIISMWRTLSMPPHRGLSDIFPVHGQIPVH